jgi:hypothetical protein
VSGKTTAQRALRFMSGEVPERAFVREMFEMLSEDMQAPARAHVKALIAELTTDAKARLAYDWYLLGLLLGTKLSENEEALRRGTKSMLGQLRAHLLKYPDGLGPVAQRDQAKKLYEESREAFQEKGHTWHCKRVADKLGLKWATTVYKWIPNPNPGLRGRRRKKK